MGQFVDECHVRGTENYRLSIHLLEKLPPVFECLSRDNFEVADLGDGIGGSVGFDNTHNYVRPAFVPPPSLVEHGEGLSDPG